MNIVLRCPECRESLPSFSRRCACGWLSVEAKTDQRCAFVDQGVRCQAIGVISCHPYATHVWYCRAHYYATTQSNR